MEMEHIIPLTVIFIRQVNGSLNKRINVPLIAFHNRTCLPEISSFPFVQLMPRIFTSQWLRISQELSTCFRR